ncbi:MAG: hypothetical protein DESF_00361 [Desulfovibrio sp.]
MSPDAAALGAMKALVFFAVIALLYLAFKIIKRTSSFVYKKSKDKALDVISKHTIDNKFYAIAESEVESGDIDAGLWAKALINSKGKEDLRKVEYIKLRAKYLQSENR